LCWPFKPEGAISDVTVKFGLALLLSASGAVGSAKPVDSAAPGAAEHVGWTRVVTSEEGKGFSAQGESASVLAAGASKPSLIKTWIFVRRTRTRWYVVRAERRTWGVHTGSLYGAACSINRGRRGYTLVTFSAAGSNFFSYAVPGTVGRWRFQSWGDSEVLGSTRAEAPTTWSIMDPTGRTVAVARGPDGVVAGLAWMSRRLVVC
jgi:hypothetical protein